VKLTTIVNLVANSTEINNKIENLRNEWNRTFLNLATQHVDELSNIIGGTDTFNRVITQKLVNNNTELEQYVSQQIDNTYEQKVQNNLHLITQNIVNNNEELNRYIDRRLQQTVTTTVKLTTRLSTWLPTVRKLTTRLRISATNGIGHSSIWLHSMSMN
jgi:ABC-type transporter lipoprotein component MlaA